MQKKRKKINGKVFCKNCLLGGLIVYLCCLFLSQQFNLSRLSAESEALDAQLAEAQRVHEELAAQKEASGTPEYIERVARDKLGYMKPEEKVFIDAKKQ